LSVNDYADTMVNVSLSFLCVFMCVCVWGKSYKMSRLDAHFSSADVHGMVCTWYNATVKLLSMYTYIKILLKIFEKLQMLEKLDIY